VALRADSIVPDEIVDSDSVAFFREGVQAVAQDVIQDVIKRASTLYGLIR